MALDFSAITAASQVPVTSSTTTTGKSSTGSTDTSVGSQDYFLKLLVAQMNNQDPLNPMDSSQMTSQLAQLNTVQGINKLSTQLDTLLGDVNTSQSLQASSLVGHGVLVPGSSLALTKGQGIGGFDLAADADDVKVAVKDSSGKTIYSEDLGKQSKGLSNFVWDGSTDSGATAAAGAYSFTVSATAGGTKVTADTMAFGDVASVTPGSDGGSVFVNGVGTIPMSQVKQVY